MNHPWIEEFLFALLLASIALISGWVADELLLAVLLAVVFYLGHHLLHLNRLRRWLRTGKSINPPEVSGTWGEIYQLIAQLIRSNRKRKRKLKSFLKRYRESTGAMPDGVVVLDADNAMEWWNSAAERYLGLRAPQDSGRPIEACIAHPELPQLLRASDPSPTTLDFIPPQNPHLHLHIRLVPFGSEQRLLVAHDVTQIHRTENIRRDFVANVSHELRTPLTVLSGYLETLTEEARQEHHIWQRPLEQMQQQTQRMQRIVEDLLFLSRLESQSPEGQQAVDVAALIDDVLQELQPLAAEKQHRLSREIERGLRLKGVEKELFSAFANLINNAIRYTPAGGDIQVRWQSLPEGACFSVSDSGIGIPAQHLNRLTERFYRVDKGRSRDTGGTGLGLAIVKHILDRHESHLQVRSQEGEGSTFSCHFPRQRLL